MKAKTGVVIFARGRYWGYQNVRYGLYTRAAVLTLLVATFSLFLGCDSPTNSDSEDSKSGAPRIVLIEPAHEATEVSRNTTSLRVTFDKPMDQKESIACNIGNFPRSNESITWQSNNTVAVIAVPTDDDGTLYPGVEYRWILNPSWLEHSDRFQSVDGVPFEEDFEISFTTAGSPDNETPSIVSMTLLCGDDLEQCGQKSDAPWEFDLARNDLKEVRVDFDKPMQASGWSYMSHGRVFDVSPTWSSRSTFVWNVDAEQTQSGEQGFILNPPDYNASYKSVWGQPLPETDVTITINGENNSQTSLSTRVVYNYYLRTDEYLDSQFYDPRDYEIERITVYLWVDSGISVDLETVRNEDTEFTLHPPEGLSLTREDGGTYSNDVPFSTRNENDPLEVDYYDNYSSFQPDGGLQYRYREESDQLLLDRFSIDLTGDTQNVAGTWVFQRDGEVVEELVLNNAPQSTEDGAIIVPNPKLTLNEDGYLVGIETKFESVHTEGVVSEISDHGIFDDLEAFRVSLTQYSPDRESDSVSMQPPFDGRLNFSFPAESQWIIDDQKEGRNLQSLHMSARYSGYQYSFTIRQ